MLQYKKTLGQILFDICNTVILLLLTLVTLYPIYYVLVASFSDPMQIYQSGGLLLFPVKFNIQNYITALNYDPIWIGYRNTIF